MRHRVTTYHVITIYNGLRVCFSLLLERTAGYTFSLKQKYTKTKKKKMDLSSDPLLFSFRHMAVLRDCCLHFFRPPPVLTTM